MTIDKKLYPTVFKLFKKRMKEHGYCCIDFTEHITELKTIEQQPNGPYILKFQLFWVEMLYCAWCGKKLL